MISQLNFFLFKPMLAEVISGSIEPPHIVNPIRRLLPHTHFIQATVESIDVENRRVTMRYVGGHPHHHDIYYDHLVIALGNRTDLSRFPGMSAHAFPFNTLGDAFFLRNHLISLLEQADIETDQEERRKLLTFVVVGAGYSGVEVASEINAFIREAARSYSNVEPSEAKVILLQGSDRILRELPEGLANFSHRVLERRGVEVRLNARVRGATAESAILNDDSAIPTRTLVATVGSAPSRALADSPFDKDARGRIKTDDTLAVPGYPGVWAIGDCAAVPDVRKGGTCPPTAQYALRQGKHLARNILASTKAMSVRPFVHRNLGVFVPLGKLSAAADVMGFKMSGFPAWWLYRSYYLLQLPRLERKLRVMIDWTLDIFFPGDIVQRDVSRSQGVNEAHYEAGDIIFHQGELARNFFIIINGEVEIFREDNAEETRVASLDAGEYFGEMALLRGEAHTATARALTSVDLLVMSGEVFSALAASSTHFAGMLSNVMKERLPDADADT